MDLLFTGAGGKTRAQSFLCEQPAIKGDLKIFANGVDGLQLHLRILVSLELNGYTSTQTLKIPDPLVTLSVKVSAKHNKLNEGRI